MNHTTRITQGYIRYCLQYQPGKFGFPDLTDPNVTEADRQQEHARAFAWKMYNFCEMGSAETKRRFWQSA